MGIQKSSITPRILLYLSNCAMILPFYFYFFGLRSLLFSNESAKKKKKGKNLDFIHLSLSLLFILHSTSNLSENSLALPLKYVFDSTISPTSTLL